VLGCSVLSWAQLYVHKVRRNCIRHGALFVCCFSGCILALARAVFVCFSGCPDTHAHIAALL
jgi:hypothetical protein